MQLHNGDQGNLKTLTILFLMSVVFYASLFTIGFGIYSTVIVDVFELPDLSIMQFAAVYVLLKILT